MTTQKLQCAKCKKWLLSDRFHKARSEKRGFAYWCKDCKGKIDRVYSRQYRELNPEWKKENNKKYLALQTKLIKEYQERYPERMSAHLVVMKAIYHKKLKRKPCVICGSVYRVAGHHQDYSKPLEVIWLCPLHHKAIHYGLLPRNIEVDSITIN